MLDEALKVLLTKRLVPPARKESSLVAEPSAPLGTFSARAAAAEQLGLVCAGCKAMRVRHLGNA
jgi:hypothetical protein